MERRTKTERKWKEDNFMAVIKPAYIRGLGPWIRSGPSLQMGQSAHTDCQSTDMIGADRP